MTDALPLAEAREYQRRQDERARLIAELRQALAERTKVRDDMLTELSGAVLPTIDEMQTLRVLGRECSDLAYALEAVTGEPFKPIDVLEALRFAMHERHAEFEHRWMRTRPTGRPDFADRPWHKMYEALEPALNGRRVMLLDAPLLEQQLLGLVWRGAKIDHQPGEHDDHANAAAGVVHLLTTNRHVVDRELIAWCLAAGSDEDLIVRIPKEF